MNDEIVEVPGYPSLGATRDGSIYRRYEQKWVKQKGHNVNGYISISVGHKMRLAHRLVAITFLGLDERSGLVVNHLNLNKSDNRVENLEVCTPAHNTRHAHLNNAKGRAEYQRLMCSPEGLVQAAEACRELSKMRSLLLVHCVND